MRWDYPVFNIHRAEFRNCCKVAPKRIYEQDLEERGTDAFANSDQEIRSRFDLVQGIQAKECRHCWLLENKGVKSLRNAVAPEQFWHKIIVPFRKITTPYSDDALRAELAKITIDDPILRADIPRTLEIVLGPLCDMKCTYCSRLYSTQWGVEDVKWGVITQEQYNNQSVNVPPVYTAKFLEWIDKIKSGVYRISILGGEPLINPEFYQFIDYFIESFSDLPLNDGKKPEFFISTNLNTSPNYFEKFFKSFPRMSEIFTIHFAVSMESYGKRAEYIRNGLNWERFNSNVESILSKTDLDYKFTFVQTANTLSVAGTKEFIEYVAMLYRKYGRPIGLGNNIVDWPPYQRPNILTPDFANYLDDCVEYMKAQQDIIDVSHKLKFDTWEKYIEFLESLSYNIKTNTDDRTAHRREFASWFDTFDQRRELNLLSTFPEYTDFYNFCKSL